VVNKPQGMIVHPAAGIYTGTLVNALLNHCSDLSGINGVMRPGIVHRIDKDTSGVLVVAKNDYAHNKLAAQLKDHSMTREYVALVEQIIKEENGTVNMPLARHPKDKIKMAVVPGGREAVTHYEVIERFKSNTLIKCVLETGRTHQIRVHMAYIGHPVVGDPVYGYKKQRFNLKGQLLHARKLGFIHPVTGKYMEFETEVPDYFKRIIEILRKK
jgi:23S rRNA pseudouridine1911/1915/1917 synthase